MKKLLIIIFCFLFCYSVLYAINCDELIEHVEEWQDLLEWVYDMDEYEFDEYYNEIDNTVFKLIAYTEDFAYSIEKSVNN